MTPLAARKLADLWDREFEHEFKPLTDALRCMANQLDAAHGLLIHMGVPRPASTPGPSGVDLARFDDQCAP